MRREKLLNIAARLRAGLLELGLESVPGGQGPILPVILRDPKLAVSVAGRLEDRGFLVGTMRPPSVPAGTSRLRIGVTALHEVEDVLDLLDALDKAVAVEPTARPSGTLPAAP